MWTGSCHHSEKKKETQGREFFGTRNNGGKRTFARYAERSDTQEANGVAAKPIPAWNIDARDSGSVAARPTTPFHSHWTPSPEDEPLR